MTRALVIDILETVCEQDTPVHLASAISFTKLLQDKDYAALLLSTSEGELVQSMHFALELKANKDFAPLYVGEVHLARLVVYLISLPNLRKQRNCLFVREH